MHLSLGGEILINTIELCRWTIDMGKHPESSFKPLSGTVFITNYRLILNASSKPFQCLLVSRTPLPRYFQSMSIPLSCIHKVAIIQPRHVIQLTCKDCRILQIFLPVHSDSNSTRIDAYLSFLGGVAFPGVNSKELFAFSFAGPNHTINDSWTIGDLSEEYQRQVFFLCILYIFLFTFIFHWKYDIQISNIYSRAPIEELELSIIFHHAAVQGICRLNNWRVLEQGPDWNISESYPNLLALPLEDFFSTDDVLSVVCCSSYRLVIFIVSLLCNVH